MHERPRWITLGTVIFALMALLAFAACGGDDDDDSGDDNAATATATRDGGDATQEPTDGGNGGNGGNDGGDEDDLFSELDELSGDLEGVTGKVSYDITDVDGETTSMTFYSKPPNARFDSFDGETTSIIITTPETNYICDTDTETCLATPGSGEDASGLGLFGFANAGIISSYAAIAEAAGVDVERSDETINGIDATCFSWEEDTADDIGKGKFCFNDAGVLTYQETEDDTGTTIMSATDYSGDVSDDDFDPPYPVTTIPGQ